MNGFSTVLLTTAITSVMIVVGMKACTNTPEELADKARQVEQAKAQKAADAKPRLFSEANGCQVWTFKPDVRWQYFTVCDKGRSTSTNTEWQECRQVSSGKSTRTECETKNAIINNEGKQHD